MRYPSIYTLEGLMKIANGNCQAGLEDGRWVPARPLGFASTAYRIKAAWLVFTGKADAVKWPGQ